ncbi:uncharacterized protein [Dermacentor albipictus]|uniref:uncharacterized protein isoform X2 n=1 Tax=Dermacentor albipictus TaxID=60249 RepID=UPI0031FD0168
MDEGADSRADNGAVPSVMGKRARADKDKCTPESSEAFEVSMEHLQSGASCSSPLSPPAMEMGPVSSMDSRRPAVCIVTPLKTIEPELSVLTPYLSSDGHTDEAPDSLGERDCPRINTLLVDYSNSPTVNSVDLPQPHGGIVGDKDLATGSFVQHSRALSEAFPMHWNIFVKNDVAGHSSTRRRKLNSVLIVCTQLAVVLILILVLMAVLFARKSLRNYRYKNPIKAADVCSNAACEMVVAIVAKSAELDVSPCSNFYRHSCGRWHTGNHLRSSYISENSLAFHVRVQQNLEALANDSRLADLNSHRMAIFYASCERFRLEHRHTTVEDVLRLSGIDAKLWLSARSFQQLFATVIAECVRSGFTSVVNIQWSGQLVYVDSGKSVVRTMVEERNQVVSFIEAAFLALKMELNNRSKMAIETLDSVLDDALVTAFSEFQPTTIRQLPTQALISTWVRGLNRGLQNKLVVQPDTLVLARNLYIIRHVIWIMSSVELNLAAVYCLLLSLSQIMRYAYILGGAGEESHGDGFCLSETAQRFPVQFPQWMAQTMETIESRDYVKLMVSTLGEATSKHADILEGLRLNSTYMSQFRKINVSIFTDMTDDVPAEPGLAMEVDNFIMNVIRLSAKGLSEYENRWMQLSTQQIKGNLMYDGTSLVVPTMQLTGDMLHAEALAPVLDYSTVGVHILNPALEARMAAYRKCTRDRSNNELPDGDVPDSILSWMLFVPWALDVALLAAHMRSSTAAKEANVRSADQLFFRRFCHTTCGDHRAAALCSYGTRHSVMFARAFGCQRVSKLAC